LIECKLIESRRTFLNFAREQHCQFSSLRRAKYSTMILLAELLSPLSMSICNTYVQRQELLEHTEQCRNGNCPVRRKAL